MLRLLCRVKVLLHRQVGRNLSATRVFPALRISYIFFVRARFELARVRVIGSRLYVKAFFFLSVNQLVFCGDTQHLYFIYLFAPKMTEYSVSLLIRQLRWGNFIFIQTNKTNKTRNNNSIYYFELMGGHASETRFMAGHVVRFKERTFAILDQWLILREIYFLFIDPRFGTFMITLVYWLSVQRRIRSEEICPVSSGSFFK